MSFTMRPRPGTVNDLRAFHNTDWNESYGAERVRISQPSRCSYDNDPRLQVVDAIFSLVPTSAATDARPPFPPPPARRPPRP